MTIKILNRGQLPEERTYIVACQHCHSTLEFKQRDALITSDQRDGIVAQIICPVCSSRVYKCIS